MCKSWVWCNAVWNTLSSWLSAPLMRRHPQTPMIIIAARPHISVSLPSRKPSVLSTVHRLRSLSSDTSGGPVWTGPSRTYYDGSDRSANSWRPAQQCLHRSPKWQCCSQYGHCPSLRRAGRGILTDMDSPPKWDPLSLLSNSIHHQHGNWPSLTIILL